MRNHLTRRGFLSAVTGGASFVALGNRLLDGGSTRGVPCSLPRLSSLDGSLVQDEGSLEMAASDRGGIVRHWPCAVLQPGSVRDIGRIIQHANERKLPVAMRGRGHACYGQALAADGIVIDSRSLNAVLGVSDGVIDVQAGASLATTARAALDAGLALPVMTNCSMLSVGGFLSAGGEARGSHRFGAFIDQVSELEVVTGDGRLVTCSDVRERELFEMVLGGMGQCAIIVRAKLKLVPAPAQVVLRQLTYDALAPFLRDEARLAAEAAGGHFDIVRAEFVHGASRRWKYRITVGTYEPATAHVDPVGRLRHLSIGRLSTPLRLAYDAYFKIIGSPAAGAGRPGTGMPSGPQRGTAPTPVPVRRRVGEPSLAVWLPASGARELLAELLASPADSAGIVAGDFNTYETRRFRRPLFRVPADEQMVAMWLFRRALADSGPSLEAQIEANARLLERAIAMGGKRYPPYGAIAGPSEWRQHYGEEIYGRFAAAKQHYDPRRVLTPGPGMFG